MAKLYFYYAAMNAGKSTALLQSSYNYQERGMETVLFSPENDTRYELGTITSRIGIQQKAIPFDRAFDFFESIQALLKQGRSLACILIDEAQFLTKKQVLQLSDIPDKLKIPVLTYGLRTDFRGELFEGSQYLLGLADELTELKTVCYCGAKAIMNMRVDQSGRAVREGAQIAIGGNELYVATCRKHFKLGCSKQALEKDVSQGEEVLA